MQIRGRGVPMGRLSARGPSPAPLRPASDQAFAPTGSRRLTETISWTAHRRMTGGDLELRDIVWGVPGRRILDGVSLRAAPGAFVGLVGPNGSGKSSLLRCIYRVHRPQSGAVTSLKDYPNRDAFEELYL